MSTEAEQRFSSMLLVNTYFSMSDINDRLRYVDVLASVQVTKVGRQTYGKKVDIFGTER